ncbi:MAG TPA: aromatic ring-hydroxylating dioxygenase subunit alpha, partial [Anaerolineae bacterium]|nr:aromatic ring-hydroxylating dioxygenase subunit alpha [Anaerolineae bacterium]
SYWIVARNYDLDPARDQSYEDFQDAVRAQDKPILEGQRPWLLPPFWTKIELPLRPADQPLIEYQKWLEELEIAVNI